MAIKSFKDIEVIDINEITNAKPGSLSFGTELQDCSIIAQTYEKSAHSTPSEAAVFAPFNRSLENMKTLSSSVSASMGGYLKMPQEQSTEASTQAQQFATDTPPTAGASANTNQGYQSMNFGDQFQSTLSPNTFGKTLLDLARECIPCDLRLVAFLELNPNVDLLGSLEAHLFSLMGFLQDLADLLKNFDIYGDFCELLNLLSFMCIPDLQRIIALLMSLLTLEIPKLDIQIGLFQVLIAPLFAPLLMSITTLLDQFNLIVVNPIDCIIDAINLQLQKLGFEVEPAGPVSDLSNGLSELNNALAEGKQTIQDKLNFYVEEVQALLGEFSAGDGAYLDLSIRKLKFIRLIGFVVAIISALTKGHPACSSKGSSPEQSEINNFFNTFLNPNGPFNLYIDDQGQVRIDEKTEEFNVIVSSPTGQTRFPNVENVISFEGITAVDSSLADVINKTADVLTQPAKAVLPCKLKTTSADAELVNRYLSELGKLSV